VRQLAGLLKPYGVSSIKVNVGGRSLQGYRREHLWDAWQRYLPPVPAHPEFPEPAELVDTNPEIVVPHVPDVPLMPATNGDSLEL
jgi:hypothetical protein